MKFLLHFALALCASSTPPALAIEPGGASRAPNSEATAAGRSTARSKASPFGRQSACQSNFLEDVHPPGVTQPREFALVQGGGPWTFHLFYSRRNLLTYADPQLGPDATEKNLGHAVSNDLNTWVVVDTAAIAVRLGRWDSQRVWAPSVIRKGSTYFMFYSGEDAAGEQRIGVATSTDLMSWAQGDSVVFGGDGGNAGSWVDPDPSDLRDPFVMEDPADPTQWLLYFAARTHEFPGMAAGFVRLPAGSTEHAVVTAGGPMWATQQDRQSSLESPHVFQRAGRWWLLFTKPASPRDTVFAVSTTTDPTDTVTAVWSSHQHISSLVPPSEGSAYNPWRGTEYLRIAGAGAGKEYFAGSVPGEETIRYTQVEDAGAPFVFQGACPNALAVGEDPRPTSAPELRLLRSPLVKGPIELELTLAVPARASITVLDAQGRKVHTIAEDQFPAGRTTLRWNGIGVDGAPLASGVYFATLVVGNERRSVRVPFVR